MKIAAKKTSQGFLISDKRCDLCEMPLLSMYGNLICKVCPAIEKWARKKNSENAQEAGLTSMSDITVEVTESCDHDLVESSFNNDTRRLFLARSDELESKDRIEKLDCETGKTHAKSKSIGTARLFEDSLSPTNSVEYASQDEQGEIVNQENDTVQVLSPCSILTTRNDSSGVSSYAFSAPKESRSFSTSIAFYQDDERVGEIGTESPAEEIKAVKAQKTLIDVSTETNLQDSAMPLLLNRLKVTIRSYLQFPFNSNFIDILLSHFHLYHISLVRQSG